MRGQVILIKRKDTKSGELNPLADEVIDVSKVISIHFISSSGNSIDVDMRADGEIDISADGLTIRPRAANSIRVNGCVDNT